MTAHSPTQGFEMRLVTREIPRAAQEGPAACRLFKFFVEDDHFFVFDVVLELGGG